jgi:Galactose oxidase, central domain
MNNRYRGGHPGPHTADCYVYDHAVPPGRDEQWTTLTPLPAGGRAGGGLVYLASARALLFAGGATRPVPGLPDAVDEPDTWMMNLNDAVPVWTEQPDLPYLSNHMSYTSAVDDFGTVRYYFVAGQIGENEATGNVNDHYEWDIATQDWLERAPMPFTRGHASSSTRGIGCGYLLAGGTTNEYGMTKDIHYYDIPTDSWHKVGNLPAALHTPVCDIDVVHRYMYCVTGKTNADFSYRRPIQY